MMADHTFNLLHHLGSKVKVHENVFQWQISPTFIRVLAEAEMILNIAVEEI
jgi:hypothetical protein